jgi:hypothetical protein
MIMSSRRLCRVAVSAVGFALVSPVIVAGLLGIIVRN